MASHLTVCFLSSENEPVFQRIIVPPRDFFLTVFNFDVVTKYPIEGNMVTIQYTNRSTTIVVRERYFLAVLLQYAFFATQVPTKNIRPTNHIR